MAGLRIALLGNCQVQSWAALLPAMVDGVDVRVLDYSGRAGLDAGERLRFAEGLGDRDLILAQLALLSHSNETELRAQYGSRVVTVANFYFRGLFPDSCYVGGLGARLDRPTAVHSVAVLDAFRRGLDEAGAVRAFSVEGFGRLGLLDAWESSMREMGRREAGGAVDVPGAALTEECCRAYPAFHTMNHPGAPLMAEYLSRVLGMAGVAHRRVDGLRGVDALAGYDTTPVLDLVAEHHGLPYRASQTWRLHEAGGRFVRVEEYVARCFAAYRAAAPGSLLCHSPVDLVAGLREEAGLRYLVDGEVEAPAAGTRRGRRDEGAGGPVAVERWSDGAAAGALLRPGAVGSILVVKLDHVGDFVLGFEALLVLRRAFPAARIELLCAPWNEGLARSLGLFDAVHTLPFFDERSDGVQPADRSGLWARVPRDRYDVAIDLRVDGDTRVVLDHVRATYRCGFDVPGAEHGMVLAVPHYLPRDVAGNVGMHQELLMLRLVRSVVDLFGGGDEGGGAERGGDEGGVRELLLGRVAAPCPADLDLARARGRPLVVVNTSSGRAAKNWAPGRFARLVEWLQRGMGAFVLLVGARDGVEEADGIVRACGSADVVSVVGDTTLGEAVGLVARASVFVGNDSGLTHVAAKLGVRTVVLFSGIDPVVMWAAPGPHVTVLRVPGVACSPCHILHMADCVGGHACMEGISEGAVRAAVRGALLDAPLFRDGVEAVGA